MGKIHILNISRDADHSTDEGYFYVGRSKKISSPLGNPFTHGGKRTSLAKLSFPTAKQAIEAYELFFDKMYGTNDEFTKAFDDIYEVYKSGKDIYLGCWCAPNPCHAEIIAKKLQQKLIKEKMQDLKKEKL
jgi:hypothetical protein